MGITEFSHLMGGAGAKKKSSNTARGSMTLREESTGKKYGNVNAKTMCKIDHLKGLALWAAAEASIPSLGALFGERLAATNEALGLRSDTFSFVCERCESILQPGNNCTVRVEKNKCKGRRRRKRSKPTAENNIVYGCHWCSHKNSIRGTPKGYVKATLNSKKPREKHPSSGCRKVDLDSLLPSDGQKLEASPPVTPGLSLLDSKRRKRNRSGAKKVGEPYRISSAAEGLERSIQASSKRRKKSWTSLKEIAESSSGQDVATRFTDLTIPFLI